jgi:hypothetical protein
MKKLLILILIGIIFFCFNITSVKAISKLHVEGRWIKNETNHTIFLRGVNKGEMLDDPNGWWNPRGGGLYSGLRVWNPQAVKDNLDAMKMWGANVVRLHNVIEWWIYNNKSYRQHFKDIITWAGEREMYVIFDPYTINSTAPPPLPFPPYISAEEEKIIPTKQAFVDYWVSVANELKNYPNVIFEIFNEPHGNTTMKNDFFNVTQQVINAIRATGADQIIMVQWDYGIWANLDFPPPENPASTLDWIEDYPLNDPLNNILYSTHVYVSEGAFHRSESVPPEDRIRWQYDEIKLGFKYCLVDYVVNNLTKPLFIGETGAWYWWLYYNHTIFQRQLAQLNNTLRILEEMGLGYAIWEWRDTATGIPYGVLDNTVYIPQPNRAGAEVIKHLKSSNFVFSVSNESYIYTNNIPYFESWNNETKTLTVKMSGSGSAWLNVFWFEEWKPPDGKLNPYIKIKFDNGTILNAQNYYSNISSIVSIPFTFSSNITITIYDSSVSIATLSGQLKDKYNNPIQADVIVYQQGTESIFLTNQTDRNGNYVLAIPKEIYDVQFNLTELNIPIKLLSVNLTEDVKDLLKYVSYEANRLSFAFDTNYTRKVQLYSLRKPSSVKMNETIITSWSYDENSKILTIDIPLTLPPFKLTEDALHVTSIIGLCKPTACRFKNNTYISFYGSDYGIRIIKFNNKALVIEQDKRISDNPIGTDDHGAPAVIVDSRGYIHVAYGSHNSQQYYAKSNAPEDVSAFAIKVLPIAWATYPEWAIGYINDTETLWLGYRMGDYVFSMVKTQDYGETWSEEKRLIYFGSGYYIYPGGLISDTKKPTSTLHMTWQYYDENRRVRENIYYAKSLDGGETWQKADGTPISLPIKKESADLVFDSTGLPQVPYNGGNYSVQPSEIGLDEDGKPYIVFQIPYNGSIGVAYYENGMWKKTIVDTGLAKSFPGYTFGRVSKNLTEVFAIDLEGKVRKYVSRDGCKSFSFVGIVGTGFYDPTKRPFEGISKIQTVLDLTPQISGFKPLCVWSGSPLYLYGEI